MWRFLVVEIAGWERLFRNGTMTQRAPIPPLAVRINYNPIIPREDGRSQMTS
jgi:hypothetical protein